MASSALKDLSVLVRSRIPIVLVETLEEVRIVNFLAEASGREGWPLFIWAASDGLKKMPEAQVMGQTASFHDALMHIKEHSDSGVFVMLDAQPYLQDPLNTRLIREIAQQFVPRACTLIFVGGRLEMAPDLTRLAARFSPQLPDAEAIRDIFLEEAYGWLSAHPGATLYDQNQAQNSFLQSMAGMSEEDVHRLSLGAMTDDGRISSDDVRRVLDFKKENLGKGGLIEFSMETLSLEDLGGVERLKSWLALRRRVFLDDYSAPGVDAPKGVLLLGVQGSGKSLAAKAIAGAWHVPLLRLDFGALYNKFLGESERNVREVLKQAEAMAPCVLWIDEIEKGLASDGSGTADGGVSRRLLGTLLTWMSERESRVFLVATSNDVTQLPPELLRKGRFDEIFFLDLPDARAREAIIRIHLKHRQLDPAQFDVSTLARAGAGFSGAELEQALVSAMYAAIDSDSAPDTRKFLAELAATRPLSVVMAEKMGALRAWSAGRTVPAA